MKQSEASRDFQAMVEASMEASKRRGLLPRFDTSGNPEFTVQQGLKAACFAQESGFITAEVQLMTLHRLDRNRNLLWVAIALLAYIALRLS